MAKHRCFFFQSLFSFDFLFFFLVSTDFHITSETKSASKINWGWTLTWRSYKYDIYVWCGHDHGHHTNACSSNVFRRTFDVWSIDYFCEIFTKIANRIHNIHQIFIFYFRFEVEMRRLRKLDLFVLSCLFVRLIFFLPCILMRASWSHYIRFFAQLNIIRNNMHTFCVLTYCLVLVEPTVLYAKQNHSFGWYDIGDLSSFSD